MHAFRLTLAFGALLLPFSGSAFADDLTTSSPIPLPYCPKIPKDPNKPVPPPPPPRPVLADEPPMPPAAPMHAQPTLGTYHRGALWRNIAGTDAWTGTVINLVQNLLPSLEQARDIEAFCPGYRKANQGQRHICWLRLVGSIVEFESSFRPAERPFCEGDGVYSVGLLALSTGECPAAMTVEALQNPVANLTCGLNRMARLIKRDHYIETVNNDGASAYWSTLRRPHVAKLPDGRVYTLGKRDQVIERTRLFNRF